MWKRRPLLRKSKQHLVSTIDLMAVGHNVIATTKENVGRMCVFDSTVGAKGWVKEFWRGGAPSRECCF